MTSSSSSKGIVPEKALSARPNIARFDSSPISDGILPVSRLLDKNSDVSLVARPISDGMLPESWFEVAFRRFRLGADQSSVGKVPLNIQWAVFNCSTKTGKLETFV